jgi:hypothetical protein
MTNRERAADYARRAEAILSDPDKKLILHNGKGQVAGAHAALALYYQREADREERAVGRG